MKVDELAVNIAALCVITLVSHDPATVAKAKRVAAAYRAEIAKLQTEKRP